MVFLLRASLTRILAKIPLIKNKSITGKGKIETEETKTDIAKIIINVTTRLE